MTVQSKSPWWTWAAPPIAIAISVTSSVVLNGDVPIGIFILAVPFLFAAVFAAVHHAELVAHHVGQPFGFVLLALAVTLIEVSLVVKILLSSPEIPSDIARDTVFAGIMIVLNGIIGLCLLIGGLKFREQSFQASGASAALGVLGTLAVLTLVLPNFTMTIHGPIYAPPQLAFVAVVSLALYALFLYVQSVRHKSDFTDQAADVLDVVSTRKGSWLISLFMLPVSLLSVVLLAELLVHRVDNAIVTSGFPEGLIGVIIALIVLLPEGVTAIRAAQSNRLQTSINIAMGSALASLCLTIPAVALISLAMGQPLILGLDAEDVVLLVLSLFMATLTLAAGRTTVLQGGIHLVIFFAFLAIAAMP